MHACGFSSFALSLPKLKVIRENQKNTRIFSFNKTFDSLIVLSVSIPSPLFYFDIWDQGTNKNVIAHRHCATNYTKVYAATYNCRSVSSLYIFNYKKLIIELKIKSDKSSVCYWDVSPNKYYELIQ